MRRRAPTTPRAKPPAQPKSCSVHVKLSYDDGPTAAPWFGFARKQLQRMVETGALRRVIPIGDVTITLRRVGDELGFAHIASGVRAVMLAVLSPSNPIEGTPTGGVLAQVDTAITPYAGLGYMYSILADPHELVYASVDGKVVAQVDLSHVMVAREGVQISSGTIAASSSGATSVDRAGARLLVASGLVFRRYTIGQSAVVLDSTHSAAYRLDEVLGEGYDTVEISNALPLRHTRQDSPYIAAVVVGGSARSDSGVDFTNPSLSVRTWRETRQTRRVYGVVDDGGLSDVELFSWSSVARITNEEVRDGAGRLVGYTTNNVITSPTPWEGATPPVGDTLVNAQMARTPVSYGGFVHEAARYGAVAQVVLQFNAQGYVYTAPVENSCYGTYACSATVRNTQVGTCTFDVPGTFVSLQGSSTTMEYFGFQQVTSATIAVHRGGAWVVLSYAPSRRTGWWVTTTAAAIELAEGETGYPIGGRPQYIGVVADGDISTVRIYSTSGGLFGMFSIASPEGASGQGGLMFDVERADSFVQFSHAFRFRFVTVVRTRGVVGLAYGPWNGVASDVYQIGISTPLLSQVTSFEDVQILNDR